MIEYLKDMELMVWALACVVVSSMGCSIAITITDRIINRKQRKKRLKEELLLARKRGGNAALKGVSEVIAKEMTDGAAYRKESILEIMQLITEAWNIVNKEEANESDS